MSDHDARRERIRSKVAASQDRLKRESDTLPAVPARKRLPDAYPPDSYATLAKEYPWLTIAAGLCTGLIVGALLPRNFGGKLGRRAVALATLATEHGLALGKQAGEAVSEAGREGLTRVAQEAAPMRRGATRAAGLVSGSARNMGIAAAREAIRFAIRVRK